MSSIKLLDLKHQISRLSDRDRKDIAAFLIRLNQETTQWKLETARRIDSMQLGKKISLSDLKAQLGHG